MTQYTHRLVFGLPFTTANLVRMQRLGVAVCEEYTDIDGPTRLSIANGTMPIAQVLAYDTLGLSQQSQNFQTPFQLNDSGTKDYYLGAISLTDVWWTRLQSRLALLPAGMMYARWMLNYDVESDPNKQVFLLRATNVNALNPFLQTAITEQAALAVVGLKLYRSGQ